MESNETKTSPIEPEVIKEQDLARPGTPITADELALLAPGRGEQVILQRAQILATTRAAHIRATFPNDWTLFKTAEGQEYGFLADQGCQRGRRLWGISLDHFGPLANDPFYETREEEDGENFSVRLTADGYCDLTKDTYLHIEGFGYSDNEDAKQASPGQRRKDVVANHARRNLEGKLIRRVGGLEAVPIEEITKCWEGTTKKVALCNKGRGYGSKDQRLGKGDSKSGGIDPQDIPICDLCQTKLTYRPGKKEDNSDAWFGCSTYQKHPETKVTISLLKLKEQIAKRRSAEGQEP